MDQGDQKFTFYLAYYGSALVLGALAALASLMGSSKVINARVVITYCLAGGLVSLGIVLLLIERYGASPFLIGVSIFAGYKAFDIAALLGVAVTRLVERVLGVQVLESKKDNDSILFQEDLRRRNDER